MDLLLEQHSWCFVRHCKDDVGGRRCEEVAARPVFALSISAPSGQVEQQKLMEYASASTTALCGNAGYTASRTVRSQDDVPTVQEEAKKKYS